MYINYLAKCVGMAEIHQVIASSFYYYYLMTTNDIIPKQVVILTIVELYKIVGGQQCLTDKNNDFTSFKPTTTTMSMVI